MKEIFPFITYKGNELFVEDVPVNEIIEEFGTPLYVYSKAAIKHWFNEFDSAFKEIEHLTCFAVKANSNIQVLKTIKELGGGADTVSKGEIFKALIAGINPEKIVFAGVGKRDDEIEYALENNILMFNVESEEELYRIDTIARKLNKVARIALRINPDVNPKTHPYISTGLRESKFGIDYDKAFEIYIKASKLPNIDPVGIHFHIGSQITDISPFKEATSKTADLISILSDKGIRIDYFNIGGGLGINYIPDKPCIPSRELSKAIMPIVRKTGCKMILEPGRRIVANAGILITKIIYRKERETENFIVVDAAMNDLMRPSLYKAYHHIIPTFKHRRKSITAKIVGPICETGDIFAENREIPEVKSGEYLAILSTGAYGFAMSSNYNSRPRAAEVLVDGRNFYLSRQRETLGNLIAGEII